MMDKKTLNIAFDAKRAMLNNTGLGNYSRRVISEMAQLYPGWTLSLFSPRATGIMQPPTAGAKIITPHGLWKMAPSLWRSASGITNSLRNSSIDLFHGLSNELPLDIRRAGIPSVVTIHDVIYRHHPENYSSIDRRIYDFKYGQSARNATRIIAISQCTARDITRFYDVDPAKIDIIYQSCDPQFSRPVTPDDLIRLKQHCPDLPERFIVTVGTVEPRKNQLLAVRALPDIPDDVSLVIVGRSRKGYGQLISDEARRLHVTDRIIWLDRLPFDLLPALYNTALAASYTSRYEGYGLPVVEALSAGTPVIAATGSCLEEAGGQGAVYVDPDDVDAFSHAVKDIIDSPKLRLRMVADGQAHIRATHATPMAQAITDTYRRALQL